MGFRENIIWLAQKLSPKGRAWRMPPPLEGNIFFVSGSSIYVPADSTTEAYTASESPYSSGGFLYRLWRALSVVLGDMYEAASSVSNAQLPDNDNFTIEDAHDWYRRLGIYDSGIVPLADMKAAILQKMSFPITPLNRQSLEFIQAQLRAAGFDVYLYQNRFSDGGGYITKTASDVLGIPAGSARLGGFSLGELNLGSEYIDDGITLAVNYIEEEKDAVFAIGPHYRNTFFVAGSDITTFADVPASRKIEFRQLLISLKCAEMCAILFVNYA